MNDQKQQIVEKLKAANNILVTVSRNPSVDQLAACIGLTLLLNKLNKHATAVFSGNVPSTIEFLKPEETIEKNTDSLRDFIIAIDKAKADKLRYKVEDEIVKIFITPYKSSISEKDLIFSQGDFNVDVVIALGVHQQQDLDDAITAHGRILHDAVVISINNTPNAAELGAINWQDQAASGMAELVTVLAGALGENILDAQIATAILTGIVAETDHFSNQKTTPQTMTASATLLAAGANQQLVAKELDAPVSNISTRPVDTAEKTEENDQLKITHEQPEATETAKPDTAKADEPQEQADGSTTEPQITGVKALVPDAGAESNPEVDSIDALLRKADEELAQASVAKVPAQKPSALDNLPKIEPLKAEPQKTKTPKAEPPKAALPKPAKAETPKAEPPKLPEPAPMIPEKSLPAPNPPAATPVDNGRTLAELEEAVSSPHVEKTEDKPETADVDNARHAVEEALKDSPDEGPLAALNAIPVNLDLGHGAPEPAAPLAPLPPAPDMQSGPGPQPGLPDFLQTPPAVPASPSPLSPYPGNAAPQPPVPPAQSLFGPLPGAGPVNQPFSMPMAPPGINVPPPQMMPPTSASTPPQGPPAPPMPPPMPPMAPPNFGPQP